jgi:glycosyltransferase involved in cell wall biosynthesis
MVGGRETGNETYVRGLIEGFSHVEGDFDLRVYYVGDAWGSNSRRVHFQSLSSASPWVRLTMGLPTRAVRDSLDVLHVTYTAPVWAPCPIVVTVHDISYVDHPEWFSARDLRVLSTTVPFSIRKAKQVVTVSELCRKQIIEHYRVPDEKVVAIPNAAGPAGNPLTDEEARRELAAIDLEPARPYVLTVGNLQPRKNLIRLISAARMVISAGVDVDLLVAGPEHYRAQDVVEAAREAGGRIKFTGYLTDRQLAACYQRATLFAFPSLFEGFGIPALEAMSHGIPVVCSNGGALPEVCGAAALYFDPRDVNAMAEALQKGITDTDLRATLVREGGARVTKFSWQRSAEQTLAVYQRVGGRQGLRDTDRDKS